KVRAGGDFAALARKNSDDPGSAAKGGDLGFFGRGTMTPAFESAAFALESGKVSDVVETPFGFHILRTDEHKPGGVKPLDAVRDEIVQTLRGEQALELARKQAEADRRAVVRGKSLAEAAAGRAVEAGLKVEETGYFERQTATLPGLPPMPELRTDALALTADAPLAPKVYAAGGDAVVAALRDRKLADMSGLAAAKDGLRDSLLQQK